MLYVYKVTYRIHNGYQFNDPRYYDETTEEIVAANRDEAYEKAVERASTNGVIAHDEVSVRKKDVVRIHKVVTRRFDVTLYRRTMAIITVEAENEEEAKRKATAEANEERYQAEFLSNLSEDKAPDIEEIQIR